MEKTEDGKRDPKFYWNTRHWWINLTLNKSLLSSQFSVKELYERKLLHKGKPTSQEKTNCVSTHAQKRVHTLQGPLILTGTKRACTGGDATSPGTAAKPQEGRGPHARKGPATLKDGFGSLGSAGSPNATQGRPGRTGLTELGRETATPGRRVARWAL